MENKEKTTLSYWPILLLLAFSLMILIKPTLFDMDSYYFASISCGTAEFRPVFDSFATQYIFTALECNLLVFKALILSVFVICLIIAEQTGRLISKKYAHWLFFFYGASLSFYSYFSKMEDDTLGLPFIFASLYYLVKWSQSKNYKDFIIALGICGIGFLFWKGIVMWGLIVLAAGPVSWILSGGILWQFRETLIPRFYPYVSEELPLAGVLSSGLILVGALSLPTTFLPSVSLAFMLALLKLKYALFLGLLCGLGLFFYMVKKNFFEDDEKKVFGYKKSHAFLAILLLVNVSGILGVYSSPPDQGTVKLVESLSLIAKDYNISHISNDWEYGHLVRYYGMIPSNEFGPPTPDFSEEIGFVLTRQKLNCTVINSYQEIKAYDCRNLALGAPFPV